MSTTAAQKPTFVVGDELVSVSKRQTLPRMQWYGDGLRGGATGELQRTFDNIHTSHEVARQQGLPGAIADGMISTAWLSSIMTTTFGVDYLTNGYLKTKYRRPAFVDRTVSYGATVKEKQPQDDGGVTYGLEIWAKDDTGELLTVGEARVTVTP
jgi:acyl dehydratase